MEGTDSSGCPRISLASPHRHHTYSLAIHFKTKNEDKHKGENRTGTNKTTKDQDNTPPNKWYEKKVNPNVPALEILTGRRFRRGGEGASNALPGSGGVCTDKGPEMASQGSWAGPGGRTAARTLTWGGRSSRDTPPAAWRGTRPEPRRRARSGSRTGQTPAGTAVPARGQFEVKRAEGRFPLPAPDRLCQSRTRGGHAPEVRALRGVRAQGGRNPRGAWPSTGCVCAVGARRRSGRGEGLGRTSPTSVPTLWT